MKSARPNIVKLPSRRATFQRPVLMRRDEICDIKFAAHYCNRDPKTIRNWCREYGIGRQAGPSAPIEISRVALEMVLQGDWDALELLRNGDRSHPDVSRYFKWLLLPA